MSTSCRFDDKDYKNWLRCSLALILFKEGLHDYINTEVNNLHADIHRTIYTIPVGTSVQNQCYSCTWRDIKRNKGTWTIKCQNKICDRWLSEILANHTDPQNRNINWKNADITRWPTDAYEVAKVYMSKGQDQTKNLPQDFDAPAILSLLKYCVWFSQKIPNTNIVSDLIDIRNEIMHTGDLRVTDCKKDICIDKMVQLLSYLNVHGDVLTELQKTKIEDIDINFRETEVRALHGVLHQLTDDLDTVQTTLSSVQDAQAQQRHDIEEVKDNNMKTVEKVVATETDIQGVKSKVKQLTEMYQKIKSFLANNPDIDDKNILENIQAIEKTVTALESKFEKKHQELETKIASVTRGIERKFAQIKEKMETKQPTVLEEMESLRNELLHRYKSLRTMPFSIDEKEEVPVEYLYTEVVIKSEDKENPYANRSSDKDRRIGKENQQDKELTSYKQIFERGKRTILTGPSGSGKSIFCRKIVSAWCKLHENKKIGTSADVDGSSNHESLHVAGQSTHDTSIVTGPSTLDSSNVTRQSTHHSSDVIADENILTKFDLLFYINSPAISNETKLTNVLCNQCIKREQEREKDKIQSKLFKLLNDQPDNILIIFDGLDEMGHTPDFLVDVFKRYLYPGISVLMVMRPWRISRLELKPLSHYDLLLDIQGFSTDNALEFVQKVIDMKSSMYGKTKKNFLSKKDRDVLTSFKNIPLLLLFLANIWYREQSLPDKYKDLYNQIIDFLIRKWVKKVGNKYTVSMSYEESMDLHLKNFRDTYFSSACKAAYLFLLEGENGQSVVIPQKELIRELGQNSEVMLNTLLDCGIMSKVDFCPHEKNVSATFLHISIQEYLASIYLVQDEDAFQKFLRSIETIDHILRYKNLFIFISGLDVSRGHKAFIRICTVCDVDTHIIQYRQGGDNYEVIQDLNVVYKKCVNEMNQREFIEMTDICITSDTDYKLLMLRLRSYFAKSLCVGRIRCDELDLNVLTSLISLRLERVIKSEECSRSLCNSISSFTHLEVLYLDQITLDDGVLDLRSLTNLANLKLHDVTMSEECSRSLCSSICSCTCLKMLFLDSIRLNYGVLDLRSLTNLVNLKLHDVTMSEECSRSLCSSICSCTCLKMLFLDSIRLYYGVLDLRSLTNLTSLKLRTVTMSRECNISLCSTISSCTHLQKLQMSEILLADVLDPRALSNLPTLTLEDITMSEECSRSLCRSISSCAHLEILDLAFITLHDCVLDLKNLTNLTTLILQEVTMSEGCGRPWYGSISILTHLKILTLSDLKLHDVVLDLRSLTNLLNLTLKSITMSEAYSRSLCSIINSCTSLEMLLLDNIKLHYGVLDLRSMTNLAHLTLLRVNMSEKCSKSLCSSISDCTRLKDLNLNHITLHDGVLDLRYLTNLTNLTLLHVTMSKECSRSMCSSISGYAHLENLHLKNIKLHVHDGVLDLRSLTNINSLRLDTVTMSKECSRYLCSSISHCNDLINMELKFISLHDGVLDLSSLINLTELTLDNVTMLEKCNMSLCSSICGCTSLENLHLHNIKLYDGVLDLRSLTNMNSLRLDNVTMSEECCTSLCSSISSFTHLEELYLEDIVLHYGVADLRSLTNLTDLTLSQVTMSEECSRSMCSSISSLTHLEKLYLKDITLHYGVPDLRSLTNLTDLTLLHVTMSKEWSRPLCSIISGYAHLENLHLKNIKLHDGILDLRSLTNMNSLRLDNITMSEECSRSLCSNISIFTHLEELYLKDIKLHDGVPDLRSLTNLTNLTLVNVIMSEECRRSLCSSISSCTYLIKLKLKFVSQHDSVLDLSPLTNLTDLTLDNVTMFKELEECSMSLFSSISGCTCLGNLYLHNIKLHDGILDLSSLTNLTNLTLDNVTMLEECSISLCNSISGCTRLDKLCLDDIILHGILDLSSLTNLTDLTLDNVTMLEECSISLCISISDCTCLEKLCLDYIILHGILDLSSLTNLTDLTLDNVAMLEECSISLCNSISGCTRLEKLRLDDIILDGILDLSSLTNLTDLKLDNVTMLKECSISLCSSIGACTCLVNLYMYNIKLNDSVLDVRFLTNMNSLRLGNVTMSEECSRSLCSSISSCIHLKEMKLQYISLHDGVLDLSSLINLTDLTLVDVTMLEECSISLCNIISGCTHLDKLCLDDIILHGILDLSSLTNLTDLTLDNVTMLEECSISLCNSISGCIRLEKLCLKDIKLHGILDLSSLTNLTDLTLNDVTMLEECTMSLCSSISACTRLLNLYLYNMKLNDGVLDVRFLTNMNSLRLCIVTMSEECSRFLCSGISSFTHLEEMKLKYILLHDGILDLSSLHNLTDLTLVGVIMSEKCSRSLCSSISRCIDLIKIKLKNMSQHDGVLDLSSLTNLTDLTLNNVTMLEECSMTLCSSISSCTCLENLHLHNIQLHDGVIDLTFLTNLISLTLDNVFMSEECKISLENSFDVSKLNYQTMSRKCVCVVL